MRLWREGAVKMEETLQEKWSSQTYTLMHTYYPKVKQ